MDEGYGAPDVSGLSDTRANGEAQRQEALDGDPDVEPKPVSAGGAEWVVGLSTNSAGQGICTYFTSLRGLACQSTF